MFLSSILFEQTSLQHRLNLEMAFRGISMIQDVGPDFFFQSLDCSGVTQVWLESSGGGFVVTPSGVS